MAAACGIVSAPLLTLVSVLRPAGVGFHAAWVIGAVLATLGLCALGAHLGYGRGPHDIATAAAAFATAALCAQVLLLLSLGLQADIVWSPFGLTLAWLVMAAGFAWALRWLPASGAGARPALSRPQWASCIIAGVPVLIGQTLSIAAASLRPIAPVDDASLLSAATMGTVASVGVAELLLLMLLACALESRLRAKLEAARATGHGEPLRDSLTRLPTRATKAAGGATYAVFDARMVDDVREQAELLADLCMALARDQLELYCQPKIHAPSAQVTAAEALLRWHHPHRGMVSPGIFIPIAERSGLIHAIGAWVIDEACKQARIWRDQGLRMRVAINLSVHPLRHPDLPKPIAAALARHQINAELLTCEITESVALEDTEAALRIFSGLAAVGAHISIDDFGSGYSNLAYLRKLPASELKIDRSFVLDLEHSEDARQIAQAVVSLAQALRMKVVAEGVETDAP